MRTISVNGESNWHTFNIKLPKMYLAGSRNEVEEDIGTYTKTRLELLIT